MSFEYELTSRCRILLDLYQICPVIYIIKKIYKEKLKIEHNQRVNWYINMYPFRVWDNKTFMLWYERAWNINSQIIRRLKTVHEYDLWRQSLIPTRENHSFIFQRMIAFYKNGDAIKKVY